MVGSPVSLLTSHLALGKRLLPTSQLVSPWKQMGLLTLESGYEDNVGEALSSARLNSV